MADDIHSSIAVADKKKKGAGSTRMSRSACSRDRDRESASATEIHEVTKKNIEIEVSETDKPRKHNGSKANRSSSSEYEFALKKDLDVLTKNVTAMSKMLSDWAPRIIEMSNSIKDLKESVNMEDDDEVVEEDENVGNKQNVRTESEQTDYLTTVVGPSSDLGPKIDEKVATSVDLVLSKGLQDKTSEMLKEKYKTPENCERLQVIACDKQVYQGASKKLRLEDKALQNIQESLTKSVTASTLAYNTLKLNSVADPAIAELVGDSLSLAANASFKLDLFRRQNFKPELAEEFTGICSSDKPVTGTLFGKQLSTEIKDCAEAAKLTKKLHKPKRKRYHPFGSSGYSKRWGGSRYKNQQSPPFQKRRYYNNNNNNQGNNNQGNYNNNSSNRKFLKRK